MEGSGWVAGPLPVHSLLTDPTQYTSYIHAHAPWRHVGDHGSSSSPSIKPPSSHHTPNTHIHMSFRFCSLTTAHLSGIKPPPTTTLLAFRGRPGALPATPPSRRTVVGGRVRYPTAHAKASTGTLIPSVYEQERGVSTRSTRISPPHARCATLPTSLPPSLLLLGSPPLPPPQLMASQHLAATQSPLTTIPPRAVLGCLHCTSTAVCA